MKRIIIILLTITILFLAGCAKEIEYTGLAKLDMRSSFAVDQEDIYMTFSLEGEDYYVSKAKMDKLLKGTAGFSVFNEIADTLVLQSMSYLESNYYDAITPEEVVTRYEEEIFPEGKSHLDVNEQEQRIDAFLSSSMYPVYHLKLAKETYYYDKLMKGEFSESMYIATYMSTYTTNYTGVFLPFSSEVEAVETLAKFNIEIKSEGWVWKDSQTLLTNSEIVHSFIQISNVMNGFDVEEGVDYILGDPIDFQVDLNTSDLFLSRKELIQYHTNALMFYSANDGYLEEGNNFYTKTIQMYTTNKFGLALKLSAVQPPAIQTVRSELKELIAQTSLTDFNIEKEMYRLKRTKQIRVYDSKIELEYGAQASLYDVSYLYFNIDSPWLVGIVDGNEISQQEFNRLLHERYGPIIAARDIIGQQLLYSEQYNKVANYHTGKVLNHDKWVEIVGATLKIETEFLSSAFLYMGFENYLLHEYGVLNRVELRDKFVYEEAIKEYTKQNLSIREASEESDVWKMYLEEMQQMHQEYFKSSGMQLTIQLGNQTTPFSEWPQDKVTLAEEFHQDIVSYLNNHTDNYIAAMIALRNAFNQTPYTPNEEAILFEGIDLGKYKNQGLRLTHEELNNFTNGMFDSGVEEKLMNWFEDTKHISGAKLLNDVSLTSKQGIHIYLNTMYSKPDIPTLSQAQAYDISQTVHGLTSAQLLSVRTYYSPIASLIKGNIYTQYLLHQNLPDDTIQMNHSYYDVDEFNKIIEQMVPYE